EPVSEGGGVRSTVRLVRWEPPAMRAEIEYQVGDNVWTHAWTSYQISEDALVDELAAAELRFADWLTDDHAWFTARPA
ncbi:MAG TPA: hypothetical protein VF821_26625, partial [Lentzea sp.]